MEKEQYFINFRGLPYPLVWCSWYITSDMDLQMPPTTAVSGDVSNFLDLWGNKAVRSPWGSAPHLPPLDDLGAVLCLGRGKGSRRGGPVRDLGYDRAVENLPLLNRLNRRKETAATAWRVCVVPLPFLVLPRNCWCFPLHSPCSTRGQILTSEGLKSGCWCNLKTP